MSILQNLNATLEKIPTISEQLITSINETDWPDLKKKKAIELVSQLDKSKLIWEEEDRFLHPDVLKLGITPKEVEIVKEDIFDTTDEIKEYVRNLLKDLNLLSDVVKFTFITACFPKIKPTYETPCNSFIEWEV